MPAKFQVTWRFTDEVYQRNHEELESQPLSAHAWARLHTFACRPQILAMGGQLQGLKEEGQESRHKVQF